MPGKCPTASWRTLQGAAASFTPPSGRIALPQSVHRAVAALFFSALAQAHVVSMSTGELHMDGPTAVFDLRMPMYEISQLADPQNALLSHIRFGDGHRTKASCQEEDGTYVCHSEYEFPGLHPDSLDVECTLYQVTVPNHVHLLTATQGPNSDQLVFDQTLNDGEIRFHPPSRAELIARQLISGARKAAQNGAGLLFLVALALAARSRGEAVTLAAVFLMSEWLARLVGPRLPVALSARFFDAALALTVAYLAVELLMLPDGKLRWLIVAVLGLFHGLSLAAFPPATQAGASAVQAVMIAPLAVGALRMPKIARRPSAALILLLAVAWFGFRLWK